MKKISESIPKFQKKICKEIYQKPHRFQWNPNSPNIPVYKEKKLGLINSLNQIIQKIDSRMTLSSLKVKIKRVKYSTKM
jgi:hypothetical protein